MKTVQLQLGVTVDEEALAGLIEVIHQIVEGARRRSDGSHSRWEPGPPKMTSLEASRHALFGGQKPPEDLGLLLDTKELAKLLKVSERTVWALNSSGRVPKPIRLGRAVRWAFEECRAWVKEGCPPRSRWVWPKEQSRAK